MTNPGLRMSHMTKRFAKSRKFAIRRVTLFMVRAPHSDISVNNEFFAGRIVGIEAENSLARELGNHVHVSSSLERELYMSGFLCCAPEQRWQTYQIARSQGIWTVDEIRAAERYGPMSEAQQREPAQDGARSDNATGT
jgi:hypothetical protein